VNQQKSGIAFLFALTSAAAALGVYLYLSGHRASPPAAVQPPTPTESLPRESSAVTPQPPMASGQPLKVPLTPEQKQVQDLEASRGPFYDLIRKEYGQMLSGFEPDKGDRAVLCLYLKSRTQGDVDMLTERLIKPNAYQYGFTHVRFYAQDDASGYSKWAVDSEADYGTDSVWRLVRK
jgi:hypothetical protein